MKHVINETHPREEYHNEKNQTVVIRKLGFCRTKTGCHDCCSRDRRRSDLDKYGVGTVLYF